jgi:DNA polymerase III subunit beta
MAAHVFNFLILCEILRKAIKFKFLELCRAISGNSAQGADMLITAKRDLLLPAMTICSGVIEKKQTLPILSNCLCEIRSGHMVVAATDLEVEVKRDVEAESDYADDFSFTLPGRKFTDICRALPEGAELTVQVEGDRAVIRSGRSRFTLGILPGKDYPSIDIGEAHSAFDIEEGNLWSLLDRTAFSMAQQDVRYYLNGLLLELSEGRIRAVATDGHRLALADLSVELTAERAQLLVPRKAVLELLRILADEDRQVRVEAGSAFARFSAGHTVFSTKLIDGRFPDYERVIPRHLDKSAMVERDLLRGALARASILSSEKYKGIRLSFTNNILTLQAHNPEQEEAEEEIEIQYRGEDVNIGFNVGYLQDILGTMDARMVCIDLASGANSAVIRDPDDAGQLYVVMPMRL